MWCCFVHVQDCGNNVLPSECGAKPFEIIVTPFIKFTLRLNALHIFGTACQQGADGSDLVFADFPFQVGGVKSVLYGFRPVLYPIGKPDKFAVQVGACRINVLRCDCAFNVCGHTGIRAGCLF